MCSEDLYHGLEFFGLWEVNWSSSWISDSGCSRLEGQPVDVFVKGSSHRRAGVPLA